MPPPRAQQAMEYPPLPPPESFARAGTPLPPVSPSPQTTVKDLRSGGEETYVFKNGETGQTFVYKKMPNAHRRAPDQILRKALICLYFDEACWELRA
jgi:hypothetical protein